MDDLISRKELLNRTIYNPLHAPYITKQDVEDMPPAQPERKKGVWVQTGMGSQCSNCWYKSQTTGNPQFCPHCGVEMQ